MTNMIEKVARAICIADGLMPDDLTVHGRPQWETRIPQAKAAIEAMLEPDREVMNAGIKAMIESTNEHHLPDWELIWQSMIRAALEGE